MEAARWNLRECSVRLRRCDLAGRGSAAPAERGVLAEPREPVIPAPPRDVKDCNGMAAMVKVELEDEDAVTYRESRVQVGHAHLQDSVTDVVWNFKEENDLVLKIEEDVTDEVTIKQELDIKPTVIQPKTLSCPLPPVTSVFSHTSPSALRPSTTSAECAAPALPCLVFVQPAFVPKTEVQIGLGKEDSIIPSESDLMLDMKRINNACQTVLKKQSYDRFDSESMSVGKLEQDRCRYCIRTSTESDYKANATKAEADTHTTEKQFSSIKHTNITCAQTEINSYEQKQDKYGSSQVGGVKIFAHGENPYRCEHCNYSSSEIDSLKRHMRSHTDEKPYKCNYCAYETPRLNHLKVHFRTHTGEKPYRCEHCNYSSSEIGNLKTHIRIHTGEKPYRCEHCNYSSSQKGTLKRHMRTHTGEKLYRCEQCEYSAYVKHALKNHMRTHTGEKPYKCGQCEYSAIQVGKLKLHMRSHTGEKPYRCMHCEYTAPGKYTIKRHMRTHTGEKPYKCEHCEYSASQIWNLKLHMRSHTGEKPYRCMHCEYRASRLGTLKIHMRIHTGGKPFK